jgi:tripartite-type tricarboxylate transporter receptor subunit TctC
MRLPHRRKFLHLAAGAAALPAVSRIARAQAYPTKPIRLLVGFGPGTPPDITARILAGKLSESLSKPVVVENVTGAGGNLAGDRVARAEPDGHTLLLTSNSTITVGPSLFEKMSFDPAKDLAPITQVLFYPNVLVVNNDVPAKNVQELIALARTRPGALTYGSAGVGTIQHLTGELLKSAAGINLLHVPYPGTNYTLEVMAGRVDVAFGTTTGFLPLVRGGKVRGLAVSSMNRWPTAAELPTVAESGFPGFEAIAWFGLFAPSKTSPAIIEVLYQETARILTSTDIRKRFSELDTEVIANKPAEVAVIIQSESHRWAKVIDQAGIKQR